jgi:cobalt-zinc-cadmium efflux system outer membrane protein
VNVRTSKIQLLQLLNDRTPIEQFEVTGPYDSSEKLPSLDEFRDIALTTRPDLKAAVQTVELASHRLAIANGSTDPTFSIRYSHNPSFSNPFANETIGGHINIPLRIFDRNQHGS